MLIVTHPPLVKFRLEGKRESQFKTEVEFLLSDGYEPVELSIGKGKIHDLIFKNVNHFLNLGEISQ